MQLPPSLCRLMLLVMLLGPNTIAGALGVPVMTIGIKRYAAVDVLPAGACGACGCTGLLLL